MRHIPNILSFIRLILVGVFIALFINGKYIAALATYVAAFATDLLDGYLARRNNWISDLGKVLDPLADKLLLIAAIVCFWSEGWLDTWILVVVLAKESLMIIGGVFMLKRKVVVYADWFGKIAAGLFNAAVVLTIHKAELLPQIGILNTIVFAAAIVAALGALVHYYFKTVNPYFLKKREEKKRS